jgi:hypothetical protein
LADTLLSNFLYWPIYVLLNVEYAEVVVRETDYVVIAAHRNKLVHI